MSEEQKDIFYNAFENFNVNDSDISVSNADNIEESKSEFIDLNKNDSNINNNIYITDINNNLNNNSQII